MSQAFLDAAARFASPDRPAPVEHILSTRVTSGRTFIAECSCGGWYESAFLGGYYAPFDATAGHQHHVLVANYAAGVAPEIKFR